MRQVFLIDAPDRANVGAVLGFFDITAAWQLRGFLTHLASTLAVTLPGQGHIPGTWAAKVACCQGEIGRRQAIINALALMFQPTCRVEHCSISTPVHACRLDDSFRT